MALPADFWRNEQMLNIFRTKPCQRLLRGGICDWRSQCQFSHNPDWPRRPPQKHRYSPELCSHIRSRNDNGEIFIENICPQGIRCSHAHSKEEVLYHPHIFKTCLCEEHMAGSATSAAGLSQQGEAGAKGAVARGLTRARCHRYYCPFAHGQQELRTSPLPKDRIELCIRAIEIFPSDSCCQVCAPHQLPAVGVRKDEQGGEPMPFEARDASSNAAGECKGEIAHRKAGNDWPLYSFAGLGPTSATHGGVQEVPTHFAIPAQSWTLDGQVLPPMACLAVGNAPASSSAACNGSSPSFHMGADGGAHGLASPMSGGLGTGSAVQMLQLTPLSSAAAGCAQQFATPTPAGGSGPLQVRSFLRNIGLDGHYDIFSLHGFDSPEAIARMSVEDMEMLGIKLAADQARLLHAAQEWQHACRSSAQQPPQQKGGQVSYSEAFRPVQPIQVPTAQAPQALNNGAAAPFAAVAFASPGPLPSSGSFAWGPQTSQLGPQTLQLPSGPSQGVPILPGAVITCPAGCGYGQLISVGGPPGQAQIPGLSMPWPQAVDGGTPQVAGSVQHVPFAPVPPFPFHQNA